MIFRSLSLHWQGPVGFRSGGVTTVFGGVLAIWTSILPSTSLTVIG